MASLFQLGCALQEACHNLAAAVHEEYADALHTAGIDRPAWIARLEALEERSIVVHGAAAEAIGGLFEHRKRTITPLVEQITTWKRSVKLTIAAVLPTLNPGPRAAARKARDLLGRAHPRFAGNLNELRAGVPALEEAAGLVPALTDLAAAGRALLDAAEAADTRSRGFGVQRAEVGSEALAREIRAALRDLRRRWKLARHLSDEWLPPLVLTELGEVRPPERWLPEGPPNPAYAVWRARFHRRKPKVLPVEAAPTDGDAPVADAEG